MSRSVLERVRAEIQEHETTKPRALQTATGGSQVGGCRAEGVLRLTGTGFTDPQNAWTWQAVVGTAIHAYLEGVAGVGVLPEHHLEYNGVPVTIDRLEPDEDDPTIWRLVDYKSKDDEGDVELIARHGLPVKIRYQLQIGAAAARKAGYNVVTVHALFLPRAGDLEGAWEYSEPFDQEIADAGAEWALLERFRADAISAGDYVGDPLEGLRDEYPSFCESYCPFVTACRGADRHGPELPAELAWVAAAHQDAKDRERKAGAEKRAAARELDGFRGHVSDGDTLYLVTPTGGRSKQVEEVDDEAIRATYQFEHGELPRRTRFETTPAYTKVTKSKAKAKRTTAKAN